MGKGGRGEGGYKIREGPGDGACRIFLFCLRFRSSLAYDIFWLVAKNVE